MKIIAFNCCLPPWSLTRKKRLPMIASALLKENPDIICLQEVFFKGDANYLISNLSKHGFVESFHFKDLLFISKIPFLAKDGFVFKDQGPFFSLAILDMLYGKACQTAKIAINGQETLLVNAHLLSAKRCDKGALCEVRKNQIIKLCKSLEKQNVEKIILAGDFNFETSSPSYQIARKDFGFFDPFEKVCEKMTVNPGLSRNSRLIKNTLRRIDYFFMKGFSIDQIQAGIIFQEPYAFFEKRGYLSDHYGLALTIKE